MFISYLKVAFRNLYMSKLYTFINILGLAIAVASCIVAYVNYEFSQSFDTYHENVDQIYTVNSYKIVDSKRQDWAIIPMPMATMMQKDIPGIERISRLTVGRGTLRYGDKVFNETFHYADNDFFEIFTYPLKFGNETDIENESGLVMSEETAKKYFGEVNPVGEQVILSLDGEKTFDFIVKAVTRTSPKNTSMPLSIMLPIRKLEQLNGTDLEDWQVWSRATFVRISDNASAAEIEQRLQPYKVTASETNPDWQTDGFYLTPLSRLTSELQDLRGAILYPGLHPAAIIAPSVTAILILLLACFNYVNTAIASAGRRLKEIGIRKAVGGQRLQLILQFLGENLVLCMIALAVGIFLAEIFVPAYESLWPNLTLSTNYLQDSGLILFLGALLLLTALCAGAYPAFYISAFQAVSIFRGKQRLGGTNKLIRVLLTFQFALAMTTIICGFMFNQNADFIRTLNMGFDRDQIIVVPVKGEKTYTLFKSAIEKHPQVISLGATSTLIGGSSGSLVEVKREATKSEVNVFAIGENYLSTMGFELLEGRPLDSDRKTDIDQAILVNETLMQEFGWASASEKYLKLSSEGREKEYRVIGVVNDFLYNGPWQKVHPAVMRLIPPQQYRYLSVKFTSDNLKQMSVYLENEWKRLFPHLPYDGFFQDEVLAGAIMVTESISTVYLYIAIISVVIASMGLFALVSLNIAKRTKEIGIRKVLGASVMKISGLISREFVLLLVVASFVAAALGYFMVDSMIKSIYAYYVDFGLAPFILSAALVFLVALLTVSSQVLKVATANPVDAIRDE